MKRADYINTMKRLQVSHPEMAQILGIAARSSRRYADGTRSIPMIVEKCLRYFRIQQENCRHRRGASS